MKVLGVGNFSTDFYWSSTEASINNAWGQGFGDGTNNSISKSSTNKHVRAVRVF
jgi:hypothetical protein